MLPTHPLATTILISAPVSLISLDFTYKSSHAVFALLSAKAS